MHANDNRSYIYRIRRKEDGLFLSWNPTQAPGCYGTWGKTGCFWRTQETIQRHLLSLIQFRVYCGEGKLFSRSNSKKRQTYGKIENDFFAIYPHGTEHRLVSTNYQWLERYEVVATEITVHGEQVMEARDFASFLNDKRQEA